MRLAASMLYYVHLYAQTQDPFQGIRDIILIRYLLRVPIKAAILEPML